MFIKNKILIIVGVALSLGLIFGGIYFYQSWPTDRLEVIYLDVGHGDSALIKTPDRQKILIDGGPDNTVVKKLGKYLPFYNRQINLVVLSHPDADHVTGLVEVLKRYEVKKILMTGVIDEREPYQYLLRALAEKNIARETAQAGEKIDFGHNLFLEVLYPLESLQNKKIEPQNNGSVVLKLSYGKTSFIFTGDAQKEVETELLAKGVDLKADVLKVAHHGSDTSSSKGFLQAVKPAYAIISVGQDEKLGLPSIRIINRLKTVGAQVLRTDELGDIKIISDGDKVSLHHYVFKFLSF